MISLKHQILRVSAVSMDAVVDASMSMDIGVGWMQVPFIA